MLIRRSMPFMLRVSWWCLLVPSEVLPFWKDQELAGRVSWRTMAFSKSRTSLGSAKITKVRNYLGLINELSPNFHLSRSFVLVVISLCLSSCPFAV
jgi:hypothetical protein